MLADKSESPSDELIPVEYASDQTPDEIKLVGYIRDKVDECRHSGSRIAYEAIWLTNIAYILGFSGVAFDPIQRQYKNVDPSQKTMRRSRMRVNKILPTLQNRLARLCKSPPQYDVRPESNSTEDKDAARLALKVLENVFDKTRFDEKRQELMMTTQQYGYAFCQVSWDPCLGDPMTEPMTGKSFGYEGDIRIDILNPFEVFTDPLAKRMEDVQWWVKCKVKKLSYFRERYPERGEAVKEEDAWLLSSQYEQRVNALTASGITGASIQQQMKNSAIEIVYYEKRSKDYSNGRMCVVASGILLEDKELPIGEFDITKFDDVKIAGKFQSEAIVTHLRPIQDQYNLLITKRAEWVRQLLAGKYVVPRGAEIEQEAINDRIEVIKYNIVPNAPGGGEPHAVQIPMIPNYAYNEEKSLDAQFDFISGMSEISRGQLPFAGIPAEGMQMLQEADETRIGVVTSANELGYAHVAKNILQYVHKNYVLPRVLKEAGDDLQYTVKDFVGADIKGNHDVVVLPGSTVPGSKVLRRQEILNAYQLGILGPIGDQKTLQKLNKMLEYGDWSEIWKSNALDEAQVKKFIDKVEKNTNLITDKDYQELDNHVFWVKELNDYRKSDKFEELGETQQLLIMYTIEWHVQAQVRMMNPGLPQQQQLAEEMVKSLHGLPPITGGNTTDASGTPTAFPLPPQPGQPPPPMPGQPMPGAGMGQPQQPAAMPQGA